MNDTIYAIASGFGRSSVCVVRLSGSKSGETAIRLAGRLPQPRTFLLATLRDPRNGEIIDKGLVLWFPAPHSFTGEDVVEFQIHGGRAVVAALFDALGACEGLRAANAGEFTRRALDHGKLDLAEVEGLADLIDAETQAQRRQALRQMEGALSHQAIEWRGKLLDALAFIEAEIDFVDERDVPPETSRLVDAIIGPLLVSLRRELAKGTAGERIRDGFHIALMGPPNAGKSTLLNVLAQRDIAIVSDLPGTTRDVIDVALDLGGYSVTLIDTAGLRDSADPLEQMGMARAMQRGQGADLILWLSEASTPSDPPPELTGAVWRIMTKIDRAESLPAPAEDRELEKTDTFFISAATGYNLERLIAALKKFVDVQTIGAGEALITRARHREAFERAANALDHAMTRHLPIELMGEDLRHAAQALQDITGCIGAEEILGEIFSRFCIGK
ncbi:tRNA uridine-5-carboxymethylaminomethyl(34) synthesis GTPase MnmE [Beijerinckia mobilis]|uniref:tRNA uridine-5-carboxymethylaminomethyl(34) synthesis GTPase MnmE n=1 Tax=Beijerinckia mobilis TaxID=231434 RepID=UPI00054F6E79|nr:tRNA uridine-5-carboxymethylaminomethyl(34) synthesis GTPase MnmE [Beijerinckia mobilis]